MYRPIMQGFGVPESLLFFHILGMKAMKRPVIAVFLVTWVL